MAYDPSNYGVQGGGYGVQQSQSSQPLYGQAYQANEDRYNSVMAGYNQNAQNFQNKYLNMDQGYQNITNNAMGMGALAQQGIASNYAQQQHQQQQSLISRGMGNSSVMDSMNRGLAYDQQMAQLQAQQANQQNIQNTQYQHLGFQNQGAQTYAGLQSQGLGFGAAMTNRPTNPSQTTNYGYQQQPQQAQGGYMGQGGSGSDLVHPVQQLAGDGAMAGGYYVGQGGWGAPMAAPYMGVGSGDPYSRLASGMGADMGYDDGGE